MSGETVFILIIIILSVASFFYLRSEGTNPSFSLKGSRMTVTATKYVKVSDLNSYPKRISTLKALIKLGYSMWERLFKPEYFEKATTLIIKENFGKEVDEYWISDEVAKELLGYCSESGKNLISNYAAKLDF